MSFKPSLLRKQKKGNGLSYRKTEKDHSVLGSVFVLTGQSSVWAELSSHGLDYFTS